MIKLKWKEPFPGGARLCLEARISDDISLFIEEGKIDYDVYIEFGGCKSRWIDDTTTIAKAKRCARKLLGAVLSDCRALLEAVEGK
jgi:hypothetical protein